MKKKEETAIETDYSGMITPEETLIIDNWFYHPTKGDQIPRYTKVNAKTKELAEIFLKICPPSQDRKDAINMLRMVRMHANAAIACNE